MPQTTQNKIGVLFPNATSPIFDSLFPLGDRGSNHAPVVDNPIANQDATEGILFTYQFNSNVFSDPDADTLTYTAALAGGGSLPAWLTFTPATRTFSGTPDAAGTVNVRVTASDGTLSTFEDFSIVVAAAGGDPALAFSTYSTLADFDVVGGNWSEQSDGTGNFMRCSYVGQNTGIYQIRKDVTGQPSEYWVAFDTRQSNTSVSCKLMKWFGYNNGNGWTSNNTWNNGYNSSFDGVMYGNTNSASNDATCVIKYVNLSFDDRSNADWDVIYRRLTALNTSSTWRRFQFHWKQHDSGVCNVSGTTVTRTSGKTFAAAVAGMRITINNTQHTISSITNDNVLELTASAGTQTGVAFGVKNAIVEVFVDGSLWLHVEKFYNHADESSGYSYFTIGDYTQVPDTWTFDVRNVKLSYVGMPT
jgi:Putative Ig domain